MSGLQLVVTNAGRAALVNAENTGTLPVTIAQVGVTATAFTANPAGSDAALPGELKRLATFAGAAVADDTIHVTIRDDSADTYSMRGFALYLADGTLFALYGQAGVILEKSTQAMLLLSADVRFTQVDATSLTFGDASFINPPATTEVQGVTEYATDAEALTGTDPARSITAKALKYVLDSRFGTGAPSVFVKGLLNLATAALFRTALELKSAALKDTGHGNGLDADTLDGQHAADFHTAIAGKADTGHTHTIANVTGLQSALDGKAATGHAHTIANVTGLQSALDAKIDDGGAAADYLGSVPGYWQGGAGNDCNALPIGSKMLVSVTGNANTPPAVSGTGFWLIEAVRSYNSDATVQRAFAYNGTPKYAQRTTNDGVNWTAWGVVDLTFDPATKVNLSAVDVNGTAATVPQRDGAGDLHARLFRPTFGDQSTISGALAYRINGTTDNYIRFCNNISAIRTWLDVPTKADVAAKADSGHSHGTFYVTNDSNGANSLGLGWTGGVIRVRVDATYFTVALQNNAVTFTTVNAAAFAQSSSRRYKRDIADINAEAALALLRNVAFKTYTMRADGTFAAGVIAEDLADGPLDFVVTRTENGDPEAVNYQPLFVLACAAMNGLADRVAALEARA